MRSQAAGRTEQGFTIAELITVIAIIAILSAVAMPVAKFGFRRQREVDLHDRLRKITDAIDRYHDYHTFPPGSPKRAKDMEALGADGYPKKLEDLTKPLELTDGTKVRFLRDRDLIDPMTNRNEWTTLSTTDDPDTSSSNGDNIYEVHSKSHALSLDGKTHYNEW
jgi:prepilin-type N-terminal cleavage/methylation domain-containing protein